jgi:hypothetical protein
VSGRPAGDATPAERELAGLAVNAASALQDERRHYKIACEENARLCGELEQARAELAEALTDTASAAPLCAACRLPVTTDTRSA